MQLLKQLFRVAAKGLLCRMDQVSVCFLIFFLSGECPYLESFALVGLIHDCCIVTREFFLRFVINHYIHVKSSNSKLSIFFGFELLVVK